MRTRWVTVSGGRRWLSMVGLFVLAAGLWASWLGWDTRRDVDPVSGAETGPYEIWQVAGLVLCLAVLAVLAARWLPPLPVMLIMAVAVAAAFSVGAALDPAGDGLWPIGAALVFVGVLLGAALCSGVGQLIWRKRSAGAGSSTG
jgi:hypothetical protein